MFLIDFHENSDFANCFDENKQMTLTLISDELIFKFQITTSFKEHDALSFTLKEQNSKNYISKLKETLFKQITMLLKISLQ